jgi:hypothetical protein
VPPQQAEEIENTLAVIKACSNDNDCIFDFSNQGAYYFLADRKNSTSYPQAVYATPDKLENLMLSELKQTPPALVLLRDKEAPGWAIPRQLLVRLWIQDWYPKKLLIGPNSILLKPSPASRRIMKLK